MSSHDPDTTGAAAQNAPFWEAKRLSQLSPDEWEQLCDGCGQCCLYKIQDEDTDEIHYTSVACHLLAIETCRCMDYEHRHEKEPQCATLTPQSIPDLYWMPETCAYMRIAADRPLPDWHPLITGNRDALEAAGVSVADIAISERELAKTEDGRELLKELR